MTTALGLSLRARKLLLCALALLASSLTHRPARAEEPTRATAADATSTQKPSRPANWPRPISGVEWGATAALTAAGVATELFAPQPGKQRWEGPVLFDDALRSALGQDSQEGRERAALLSDVFAIAPLTLVLSDVGVAAATGRGRWYELLAIDVQAIALSGIAARGLQLALPRRRPDAQPCQSESGAALPCTGDNNASFPSGHSAMAATAAGLVCSHHRHLSLYGNAGADAGACVGAASSALGTAVLRVMSDRHYTTDVLSGLALGAVFGYALPELWHYRAPAPESTAAARTPGLRLGLVPVIGKQPGLLLAGSF